MKRFIFIIILLFSTTLFCFETEKKPGKAAVLSLLVPSGGQVYNESYWRAGLVFATEGYLIGLTLHHNNKAKDHRKKMKITEGDLYEHHRYYYTKYSRYRQSDIWWLGGVVFMSVLDAYVEAHLYNFKEKNQEIQLKFEKNMLTLSYNF